MKLKIEHIRQRMKVLGLTQEDLGRRLGDQKNPRQTANNLLRRGKCSEETGSQIASFLHCNLEDIKEPLALETEIKAESDRIRRLEVQARELQIQLNACEAMGRTKDELIDALRQLRDTLTGELNDCKKKLDEANIETTRLSVLLQNRKKRTK